MQRIATSPECVSDLALDQWYAGELGPAELERVQSHVASCASCLERQRVMFEEHSRFLELAPSFAAQAKLVARPPTRRRKLVRAVSVIAGAAALAASVLLTLGKPSGLPTSDVRTKGESHLGVYIKRGDRVVRGKAHDEVHPGDLLRFTYSTPHAGYIGIFGLDEHAATSYVPSQSEAAALAAGMDKPLDFAVKLDDQLGTETIYALWCPSPFALEPIRSHLEKQHTLAQPSDACVQSVLPLRKVREP